MSPDDLFEAIARHARSLRDVGVTQIDVVGDGYRISLSPITDAERMIAASGEAGATARHARHEHRDELNAMDDPMTFGGRLPGYDLVGSPPNPVEDDV